MCSVLAASGQRPQGKGASETSARGPPREQTALDLEVERVRAAIASSYDLAGLQKPCENAFKLYLKTRPPAVPESIKRAKTLPRVSHGTGWPRGVVRTASSLAPCSAPLNLSFNCLPGF